MYTESTLIIETLIALFFSAFFSGMEIAYVSSSKLRFEMEREQRGFTSRLIDTFYRPPESFISTLLVGNNIALGTLAWALSEKAALLDGYFCAIWLA